MKSRREFLKSVGAAAAIAAVPVRTVRMPAQEAPRPTRPARIRFAAIGLNHGHITGQVDAATRGGGQLVSFFAKEPELVAEFAKRFPSAHARLHAHVPEGATVSITTHAAHVSSSQINQRPTKRPTIDAETGDVLDVTLFRGTTVIDGAGAPPAVNALVYLNVTFR